MKYKGTLIVAVPPFPALLEIFYLGSGLTDMPSIRIGLHFEKKCKGGDSL